MTGYRTRLVRGLLTAALVALVAVLPQAAEAFHRDTPFLSALSACPGGDSARPFASRSEPRFIAFDSNCDLLGTGIPRTAATDYLEDFRIGVRVLGQMTNHRRPPKRQPIDNGAVWVAFDSNGDFVGQNPSGQRQIFLRHKPTSTNPPTCSFVQLTNNPERALSTAIHDEQGRWLTFVCRWDLFGAKSSVGTHVFVALLNGRVLAAGKLPDRSGHLWTRHQRANPFMSADSPFRFFDSDAGRPRSASNGFKQIYGYDRPPVRSSSSPLERQQHQPTTDKVGRFVTFQSDADLLAKGVPGTHVYLLDRAQRSRTRAPRPQPTLTWASCRSPMCRA